MRTTKTEWICLARAFQTGGEYNPKTGGITPIELFRQELWVKGFWRPNKDGAQYEIEQVATTDGGTTYQYKNLNYGKLYLQEIPKWPAPSFIKKNGSVFEPKIDANKQTIVYVYWNAPSANLDAAEVKNYFSWIPILGVSNTAAGTRFSKHYECLFASEVVGFSTIYYEVSGPPTELNPTNIDNLNNASSRIASTTDALKTAYVNSQAKRGN